MLYRDYDQAGLDAQYNNRARHPGHPEFFARYATLSERTRRDRRCELDIAYGPSPAETVDVFPAGRTGAPLNLFIHGGYWRSLDKSDFSFVAAGLAPAGVTVAVVNYGLAPVIDIDEIVRQNRAAVAWLYRNAERFNADPQRLYVSGHSAGGHLTAMILASDWPLFAGLPEDAVKGGCAISGVFDLEPVRLTYLNQDLRLDAESAARNSPAHHLPLCGAPLIVAVGGDETGEFLRQSRDFAVAWKAKGFAGELLEIAGEHHFEIVEALADAEAPLTRAMLHQMGLGAEG